MNDFHHSTRQLNRIPNDFVEAIQLALLESSSSFHNRLDLRAAAAAGAAALLALIHLVVRVLTLD